MSAFYKSKSNFARFKKKMTSMAYVLPKSQTLKNVARYLSKKSHLRWPIDRQAGERAEKLIQYQRQLLYHIC